MKFKTLIPFIVILAILVGIVLWQRINTRPVVPIATQIGLETLVPEGLQKDTIKKLEMYAGEKPDEKIVLERDGDAWRITSLFNAPGNKETIDGFIEKLLGLKGEPRAQGDTEERLSSFALTDKEAFHVCAYPADAETPAMNILFGKAADFRTVFLRKADDNRVFVESTNLRREAGVNDTGEDTAPKPEKWLQTKLLDLQDKGITKLAVNYPDKALVLTREEEVKETEPPAAEGEGEGAAKPEPEVTYKWVLSSGGFNNEIKESEVKTLLTRFANLAVTNVADPARKTELGFDDPKFSITISRENEEDVILQGGFDKPGGDTFIKRMGAEPDLIYQISKYNFEQIFLQGSKLFTLPEWSENKDKLRSISITGPQENLKLAWDEGAWKLVEPALNLEVQKTAIDNLVSAVATLKPVDYADAGRDTGAFDTTVTVTREDGTTRTLYLGQPSLSMDGQYVKFDDSAAALVMSRADAEKLTPPVRDMFVMSVLNFEVGKVKQLHITGEGADLILARGDGSSQWSGTYNGSTIAPDPAKVDELINALNDFQMKDFILNRAPESVQTASKAVVTLEDGSETVIGVSAESEGNYEIAITGMPCVFTAGLVDLTGIIGQVSAFQAMVPPPTPAPEVPGAEAPPAAPETTGVLTTAPPQFVPVEGTNAAAVPAAPAAITLPSEPAAAPASESVVVMPPAAPEATLPAEAPAQ